MDESAAPGDEQARLRDLSYEDALLDAQLRLFLRAEYEDVQPPEGQYNQVTHIIAQRSHVEPRPRLLTPLLRGRIYVYRKLTGPVLARLAPGGVALALLLMVLGTNASVMLRGDRGVLYGSYDSSAPTPVAEELRQPLFNKAGNPEVMQPFVPQRSAEEVYIYDPVELHQPASRRNTQSPPQETREMPGTELRSE